MKNIYYWILAAFSGVLVLLLISALFSIHTSHAISLGSGWKNAPTALYHDCTIEEGKDPNTNHCQDLGDCSQSAQHSGFPFLTSRPNSAKPCMSDTNRFGLVANIIFGALSGMLLFFIAEKRWDSSGQSR